MPGLVDDPRITLIDAKEFNRSIEMNPPPFGWGTPPVPSRRKKAPPRGEINQNLQLADALDEVSRRIAPGGRGRDVEHHRPPAVLVWEDDCHVCRGAFRALGQPQMQGVAPGMWGWGDRGSSDSLESGLGSGSGSDPGSTARWPINATVDNRRNAMMTPLVKVGNGGSGVLLHPRIAFDGVSQYLRATRGRYNPDVGVWRLWADELGSPDLLSHRTYSAHRG